jgi:hypothetical protein
MADTTKTTKAYDDGYEACYLFEVPTNPYAAGTAEHADWAKGYADFGQDYMKGPPAEDYDSPEYQALEWRTHVEARRSRM